MNGSNHFSFKIGMESLYENMARELGIEYDVLTRTRSGQRLMQQLRETDNIIRSQYEQKTKEQQEAVDIANRKVELLEKELDILYDKYVEAKAQAGLQRREDASGSTKNRKEG